MKHTRKIAATAAALTVTLSACSSYGDGAADASPDDGSTNDTSPVTVTVAIDQGLDEGAIDAFNERVAQFEDAHPDIVIEPQEYTWTATTFTAQLAGGTLPDVFTIPFTDGRGLIERGQIADISAFVAELPYAADFNPHIAEAGSDNDGNMWAIPIAAYGQGLHYNRMLFEEAGLDPDQPPATWAEVRQAAKQIADETGQAGYAQMTQDNTGGWIMTTLAYAFGGRTESVDGDSITATINTPEMVEALETVQTMRWEDKSMGANFLYDWGTINQDFAADRIGMHVSGGGNYGALFTQNAMNPEHYGLTVLPLNDEDAAVLGGGTLAAVSPNADEAVQGAAVKWIDFYYMEKLTVEDAAVADARTLAESGQPVGAPQLPIFDQETYEQSVEWVTEYVNVPLDQMAAYTDNVFDQPLVAEPAHATQAVYSILDPVIQTVLTDQSADIASLLVQAEIDAQAAINAD